jgi:hypothetical protein
MFISFFGFFFFLYWVYHRFCSYAVNHIINVHFAGFECELSKCKSAMAYLWIKHGENFSVGDVVKVYKNQYFPK